MRENLKLVVIIMDSLSSIAEKGEITERYYNPENLFSEVTIIILKKDNPEKKIIQKMTGTAKLNIYTFPISKLQKILGWLPFGFFFFNKKPLKVIDIHKPDVIRCHGYLENVILANNIYEKRKIPYIASIHINPDVNTWNKGSGLINRAFGLLYSRKIRKALSCAAKVLPVYKPIIAYTDRLRLNNVEVAYNVLNPSNLVRKTNYNIFDIVKIVSVGRIFNLKNPINIIKAIERFDNVEFHIYGDGPYREKLNEYVSLKKLNHRVKLIKSISNDKLCKLLHTYDLFVTHSEHFEISKSVLEPLLIGLPIILNKRKGPNAPELLDAGVLLVEDSKEGYKDAIEKLILNQKEREHYGKRLHEYGLKHFSPKKTEAKYVRIYKEVLQ